MAKEDKVDGYKVVAFATETEERIINEAGETVSDRELLVAIFNDLQSIKKVVG